MIKGESGGGDGRLHRPRDRADERRTSPRLVRSGEARYFLLGGDRGFGPAAGERGRVDDRVDLQAGVVERLELRQHELRAAADALRLRRQAPTRSRARDDGRDRCSRSDSSPASSLVGATNTLVSFVAYSLLRRRLDCRTSLAAAIAFAVGAANGYVFNRRWTFAARDSAERGSRTSSSRPAGALDDRRARLAPRPRGGDRPDRGVRRRHSAGHRRYVPGEPCLDVRRPALTGRAFGGRPPVPVGVEVPREQDARRRIPLEHAAPVALCTVRRALEPAAAGARLDDHGLGHLLADVVALPEPPRRHAVREHVERPCLRRLHGDRLVDGELGRWSIITPPSGRARPPP